VSDEQTPTVYVVTSGEYSDYQIRGLFLDEPSARRYASGLRVEDAEVTPYQARGPEFVPGRDISLWTRIDARTGDIEREWSSISDRDAKAHDGQCSTWVYETSRVPAGVLTYTVHTTADVTQEERARKSHAERVAKKRAEVMGL
jgi:hypothetical protein